MPVGCVPYSDAANARSATADGTFTSCSRRFIRRFRTRSNSAGRNRGRQTMSESSEKARSLNRESEVSVRNVASGPTSVSNRAPIRARAPPSSSAPRSPAPSSSMSPVRDASPGLSGGSADDPTRAIRTIVSTGMSRCRTVHTARPLGSRDFRIAGKVNGVSAPSRGRRDRSTTSVHLCRCRAGKRQGGLSPGHDAEGHPWGRGEVARGRAGNAAGGGALIPVEIPPKKPGSPRKTLYAFS